MEPIKSMNLLNLINDERTCLGFTGFYPLAKDKKYKALQKISASFFTAVVTTYMALAIMFVIHNISNLELFSEACVFLLGGVTLLIKMTTFLYYQKELFLLEKMLHNPLFTEVEAEEKVILKKHLRISRIAKILSVIYIYINILFGNVYPLITKKLFLLMWFPFDIRQHFYKVYLFEMIVDIFGATFIVAVDLLAIFYFDLCAAQFELLQHRLLKIGATFTGDEVMDNKTRVEKLKKYVSHHNYIYSFSQLVMKIFSIGVFVQIICSSLITCFGLFKALVTPMRSIKFGMYVGYTFDMLWHPILYCYFGQKVFDASNTITEACFKSNWCNCGLEVQKHLLLIMSRANNSVIIRAGGTLPLTLKTLMSLLYTAYSFFTIIWKIYKDN